MKISVKKILEDMPKDLTDIEKVRYIYLSVGDIFSYDRDYIYLGREREILAEYSKEMSIDDIEKINVSILHGKIGADIAKKKYGVNEQIQKAIQYHTETNPNMDTLAKIIYVSDKIEKNRKSEKFDLEYERNLAKEDIDAAVLFIIDASIKKVIKKGKLLHPTIVETRNKIIMNKMQQN